MHGIVLVVSFLANRPVRSAAAPPFQYRFAGCEPAKPIPYQSLADGQLRIWSHVDLDVGGIRMATPFKEAGA